MSDDDGDYEEDAFDEEDVFEVETPALWVEDDAAGHGICDESVYDSEFPLPPTVRGRDACQRGTGWHSPHASRLTPSARRRCGSSRCPRSGAMCAPPLFL